MANDRFYNLDELDQLGETPALSDDDKYNIADLDKISASKPKKKIVPAKPVTVSRQTTSPPTPNKRSLNQDEIEDALRQAGWKEDLIPTMSAITMGEGAIDPTDKSRRLIGSFNPGVGPGGKKTAEKSYGLLQINMIHPERQRKYSIDRLKTDPVYNFEVARDIFENQRHKSGNPLNHWGAYYYGTYKNYLRKNKGKSTSPVQEWTPSAETPSGAPAVDFEKGKPVPTRFPTLTPEEQAIYNQEILGLSPNEPPPMRQKAIASKSSTSAVKASEYMTDSAGNQYLPADDVGIPVPQGYTRVKSQNKETKEDRFFLVDKDGRILPEVKPGVPINPNSKYDTDGNEYLLSSDQSGLENYPKGVQRLNKTDEKGQTTPFLSYPDGKIKQEGALEVPPWLLGKTPGKSPLPPDKTLQTIYQRLLKAGAKDSEELRQRLIQGYNDKKSGKSPTMFNQDEINLMEDLNNRMEIALANGQPPPTIQKKEIRQLPPTVDGKALREQQQMEFQQGTAGAKRTQVSIPVQIPETVVDTDTANRLAAEQGIKKSGKYARGKEYDELETKAIVDRIEETRGSSAVDLDTNKPVDELYKTNDAYTVTSENMAENEAYLEKISPELQRIRSAAMYKFIASGQELDDRSFQTLRDIGWSDEDIKAAFSGEGDNPNAGSFALARQAREQNKITYDKKMSEYAQAGDSPAVASIKAYRDIGVLSDEEVENAIAKQAEMRKQLREGQKYENQSKFGRFWDDLTRLPEGFVDFVNPVSIYQDAVTGKDFEAKTEEWVNAQRIKETEDFIKEKELRYGSLEGYSRFLETEKGQEWNVWRQAKQFLRTVGQMGSSVVKTGGVIDSVTEKLNPLNHYLLPDEYSISLRTAFNVVGALGNLFRGDNGRPWVELKDSAALHPLIQISNEFNQWMGEDEYLKDALSGKVNSALASGLTFLAGGMALKGVKYGAGLLGVATQVGSTYDDLVRKGVSPDEAKWWSLVVGIPTGFSEQWGLGGAGQRALARLGHNVTDSQFKILARSMWDFAKSTKNVGKREALEEFLQEWGQSTFGNSAVNAISLQDATAGEKIKQFFADIPKETGKNLGQATIAAFTGGILGMATNTVVTGLNYGREKAAILGEEYTRGINVTLWNNSLKIDGEKIPITDELKPLTQEYGDTRQQIVSLRREVFEETEGKQVEDLNELLKNPQKLREAWGDGVANKLQQIADLTVYQQELAKKIAVEAGFAEETAITSEQQKEQKKNDTSLGVGEKPSLDLETGEKQYDLEDLDNLPTPPKVQFSKQTEIPTDVEEWLKEDTGQRQTGLDLGVQQTNQTDQDFDNIDFDEAFQDLEMEQPKVPRKMRLPNIVGENVQLGKETGRFVGFDEKGQAIVDHNPRNIGGSTVYGNRSAFDLEKVSFEGKPLSEYEVQPLPTEKTKPTKTETKSETKTETSIKEPEVVAERPPLDVSLAEQRRKEGKFTVDGVTYTRQGTDVVENAVSGKLGTVKFSNDESPQFRYALIEADQLQPADLGGNPNYSHFLPEAQPKDRSGKASTKASDRIAQEINLMEVGDNPLAYSGAPITNQRGEVIQGNNRAEGIKKSYGLGTSYLEQLKKEWQKFGFPEAGFQSAIQKMKKPVVVRVLSVSDESAIKLGNYTQNDIETGKGIRLNPVAVANRIPYADQMTMIREIFRGVDTEGTLNQAIRANIERIAKKLKTHIGEEQFASLFQEKTFNPTPEGIKDLENLFKQFLFAKGSPDLMDAFDELPAIAQDAIVGSIPIIFAVPQQDTLVPEIQQAIQAAYQFLDTGIDEFGMWEKQPDMLAENYAPVEIYAPVELALAQIFVTAKRHRDIKDKFRQYAVEINGTPATMFEEEISGVPKSEAIETVFDVKFIEVPRVEYDEQITQTESETAENDRSDNQGAEEMDRVESAQPTQETVADEKPTIATKPEKEDVSEAEKSEPESTERLPDRLDESPIDTFNKLQKGIKVILSQQLDYLSPNEVYEIIDIGKGRDIYFQSPNGSKTYVRKSLVVDAIKRGVLQIQENQPTIDKSAQEAATSPTNDLPEPTQAQKEEAKLTKNQEKPLTVASASSLFDDILDEEFGKEEVVPEKVAEVPKTKLFAEAVEKVFKDLPTKVDFDFITDKEILSQKTEVQLESPSGDSIVQEMTFGEIQNLLQNKANVLEELINCVKTSGNG